MRDDLHDEEDLGCQVDAWLTTLRSRGLSDRRVRELAGLLGNAMSESGPRNATESRVLRRFEAWSRTGSRETPSA